MKSRLIKTKFKGANKSEKNYHDFEQKSKLSIIDDGRLDLAEKIRSKLNIHGNVLEMGSGHSWMTGTISKSKKVNNAWCIDSSKRIMTEEVPKVFKKIKADEKKITRVLGSFYEIPCEDNYFDFIIFESSFHHVADYSKIFKEIKRILKKDGIVICTRERFLPANKFETLKKYKSHKKHGILERIFTYDQYRYIAEMNHFHLTIEPFFWYPKKNKKLKHWLKLIVDSLPLFRNYLASKTGSLIMIMRPKPFEPIE